MSGGFKRVFFLSISMLCVVPASAQIIDDIPLFEEGMAAEEKNTSLALTPKFANAQGSIERGAEPNIGRRAIPLDKVVLTPEPLPEVSINLRDDIPQTTETAQPNLPVNTRQEGIYISPTDRTEISTPSAFANVHDVRQFDIEGFYLGMSPKVVLQTAQQKGYKVTKLKKALPLFQTTYYETLCRQSGIRMPDKLRACIRQYAKNNGQDYVEEMILTRKATRETFHFIFTSPATGNEAYRIVYQNKGDNSLNFMHTNLVKKLNRKEAFFNAVFSMYGYPDDNEHMIWGVKEDAYMQVIMTGTAYDATIKMEDVALSNEDYFAAEDWKADQEPLYHFGFAE